MNLKIILLGKKGLLGGEFMKVFSECEGFVVDAYDREGCDITVEEDLRRVIEGGKADFVVNCTAYTNVDGAEEDAETAFAVNGEAVGLMAKVCREAGATLIHFSTDYVFDGEEMRAHGEEDALSPINVYGSSKAFGEKLIMESGCRYVIVRTAWLYGKFGKNFVDTMMALSEERDSLKVVNDQFGSPTYAWDLAKAVVECFLVEGAESGVYHITNSGEASWYDLAKEVFALAGREVFVEAVKSSEFVRRAKRPQYSVLLNNKLKPLRDWREALREYVDLRF